MIKDLPTDTLTVKKSRRTRDLANSEFLEETGVSRLVRGSIYVATFAVTAFVVWTYFATVQEIVQTTGKIVPRDDVRTVQHLEGGILSEVLVKPGQQVAEGDILARLDASTARSQLAQNTTRLINLKLEEERHRAFAEAREPQFDAIVAGYSGLKMDQLKIFESERTAKLSQISVLEKQISEKQAELVGIRNNEKNTAGRIRLMEEEFAIRDKLFKRGLQSRVEYLQAKQKLLTAQHELQRLEDERLTAIAAISGLTESRHDLDNRLRQEALRRLGQVIGVSAELEDTIVSLKDRVNRLVVRSPVAGLVQEVPLQANSGVLPPGGIVAKIVPVEGGLLVESHIDTRDIGFLEAGQPVTVKVNAFDYSRYGVIDGRLNFISPSTFLDDNNSPYYLAKIELDKSHVGVDPAQNQILPGMTAQADITTGTKTIFQYILKPIYTVLNESFFER